MLQNEFPAAVWSGVDACFLPLGASLPVGAHLYAAIVFAFYADRCAIADIVGRGWCIPGGRLEPGETTEATIRREAHEETGLTLGSLRIIGHYHLIDPLAMSVNRSGRLVPVGIATIRSEGALPAGTESRGVRLVTLEELPSLYYLWDPLIAAVCEYAFSLRDTLI